jgi:hypothetical protein
MKDFNFKYLFFAVKQKQDILFAQDILYAPLYIKIIMTHTDCFVQAMLCLIL